MRMIPTFMPAGIELFFQEVFDAVEDRSAPPPPVSAELIDRLVTASPRYGLEFVSASAWLTRGSGIGRTSTPGRALG
jgi:hypothetical protein